MDYNQLSHSLLFMGALFFANFSVNFSSCYCSVGYLFGGHFDATYGTRQFRVTPCDDT